MNRRRHKKEHHLENKKEYSFKNAKECIDKLRTTKKKFMAEVEAETKVEYITADQRIYRRFGMSHAPDAPTSLSVEEYRTSLLNRSEKNKDYISALEQKCRAKWRKKCPQDDTATITFMRRFWKGIKSDIGIIRVMINHKIQILKDLLFHRHVQEIYEIYLDSIRSSENIMEAERKMKVDIASLMFDLVSHLLCVWREDEEIPDEIVLKVAHSIVPISLRKNKLLRESLINDYGSDAVENLFYEALPYVPRSMPLDFMEFRKVMNAVPRQIKKDLLFISLRDNAVALQEDIPASEPSREISEEEQAAIDFLKPEEREIFELVTQGNTAKEIGEILGMSASAVEGRIKYARQRLRKAGHDF